MSFFVTGGSLAVIMRLAQQNNPKKQTYQIKISSEGVLGQKESYGVGGRTVLPFSIPLILFCFFFLFFPPPFSFFIISHPVFWAPSPRNEREKINEELSEATEESEAQKEKTNCQLGNKGDFAPSNNNTLRAN